jgi:alkylation response protein AidB-like acyl-CoA dehydrogenase
MEFSLDDEQRMIVQTVKRFADQSLRSWTADADRAGEAPERLTAAASEMGFFLDAVPADADGLLDGEYSHTTRALRGFELGRGCAALGALLETNVEAALAVGRWGSAAAKQSLFASLASGGLATLVHDSRSTLDVSEAGGEIRVTGKLGPAPALGAASHVLVIARDHLLLIALDGVKRETITPSGWRAAKWGTAQLESTRVTSDFVIAKNDAAKCTEVLSWARVSLAARAAGVATAAMEYAETYGQERVQFGQPIGQFEALIRMRDEAQTLAHAAKLFALNAAWAIDTKQPNAADLASRARVIAGDAVTRATIDAVQYYGGYGFVNDFPVEKLMRDARAFEALLGDERLGRTLSIKAKAKE